MIGRLQFKKSSGGKKSGWDKFINMLSNTISKRLNQLSVKQCFANARKRDKSDNRKLQDKLQESY